MVWVGAGDSNLLLRVHPESALILEAISPAPSLLFIWVTVFHNTVPESALSCFPVEE